MPKYHDGPLTKRYLAPEFLLVYLVDVLIKLMGLGKQHYANAYKINPPIPGPKSVIYRMGHGRGFHRSVGAGRTR